VLRSPVDLVIESSDEEVEQGKNSPAQPPVIINNYPPEYVKLERERLAAIKRKRDQESIDQKYASLLTNLLGDMTK